MLLVLLLSLVISGCQNDDVSTRTYGTYIYLEEDVNYGEIDLTVEGLSGEIVYSFETQKTVNFNIKYDIDVKKGDFKIQYISNGIPLDETLWTSKEQEKLDNAYKDKNPILNGVGGTLSIRAVDEHLSIVVHGKNATGNIKITW